jgi:heptose I phosphotransferase
MLGPKQRTDIFIASAPWADLLRQAGINCSADVFDCPLIRVWRKLDDRENATLDLSNSARLHVKRYLPSASASRAASSPSARAEYDAWQLLRNRQIPALELAAWGELADGRSFIMACDLGGYESGQALLRRGVPFAYLAGPTAQVAAKLHGAGLHHQDLYLCHFFLTPPEAGGFEGDSDCRLIDVARVGRLPGTFFARRWIVKDLAQFWYSASGEFGVGESELSAWLEKYALLRGLRPSAVHGVLGLKSAVLRKVARIARHDASLKARQPGRNVSIPNATPTRTGL